MVAAANLEEVAALVGDTARATMLAALMSGQALTGTELASLARVSRSTASEHLSKLVEARMITLMRMGRYSYYRISSPLVAQMMESIIAVAAIETPPRYRPRSAQEEALRFARTCYNHLAGRLGVAITDSLIRNGHLVLTDDGGELTAAGSSFLADFGADISSKSRSQRCFCKPCLDWSERRYHVAGRVGTEIWRRFLEMGWVARRRDTRAVRLTPLGQVGIARVFDIGPDAELRSVGVAAPRQNFELPQRQNAGAMKSEGTNR